MEKKEGPISQIKPAKKGDEFMVTIEGVGNKGDGFARINGFVLFVSNSTKGDSVKVRVDNVNDKVGFAHILIPSKEKGIL